MNIGESKVTNMVLKMLGNDLVNQINNYVDDVVYRDFLSIKSVEEMNNIFSLSMEEFLNSLNEEELMCLRSYTGYNFRNINSLLRGTWSYENNGMLDTNKQGEFRKLSDMISRILGKFNFPLINIIAYRGVTLSSFKDYGVSDLEELQYLKGKFLYEQGFTSTSILEDTCYFNKNLETGENYNVKINYLIPSESNDGALLIDYNTSYSTNQNEFLLDKGSLSKVIDVVVDKEKKVAFLTLLLIPKKIYDINKVKNESRGK